MSNKIIKVNMITETGLFPKGHGVYTAFVNMSEMLRQKGVEIVVNSKEKCDITHLQTVGPYSLYKLLSNRPTVISAHVVPESFIGSLIFAKYWHWEAKVYLRSFYNRGSLVLAVAPKVKDQLVGIGVKKPIEVFPNPINENIFKIDKDLRKKGRELLKLKESDFIALQVGQLQPRKGFFTFVEVAKKHPDIKFVWVGGRPFKKLIADTEKIDTALDTKPKNLSVFEHIDYKQMPSVYNAADVFFFPSYQENAPMAVIEAASCGLPLILRDIEEYRLLYGENYIKSKEEEFGDYIKQLREDKKHLLKMQKASLALAKNYSFSVLGDKLIGLYKTLI